MENRGEEAIRKATGPCVIFAGAGTGKTYTIVEKIKYLVSNKIYEPEKIVCITFSNEAANNLLSRVRKALNLDIGQEVVIKTFHAFSAQLLREHGDKIGLNKEFKILDPNEAMILLHQNLRVPAQNCLRYISSLGTAKDLGVSIEDVKAYLDKNLCGLKAEQLSEKLSNLLFEVQMVGKASSRDRKHELVSEANNLRRIIDLQKFVTIWNAYEKIKANHDYQDYSDLTYNALKLLTEFPEISKSYDYIIVDEFQDTNKVQLEFLIKLASHENITVVGDMNQSIYRFRGAYRDNIRLFKEHFCVKDSEIFALDKSYRSPNKVLKAAHSLILHNYKNPEECFPVFNKHDRAGESIEVYELLNGREEARKIVELVENEIKGGVEAESICVMFRTHQQGRIIRKVLDMNKIPYCAVGKD